MPESPISIVKAALKESLETTAGLDRMAEQVLRASELMVECLRSGKKIMFCGNGGSAADSQHLACELVEKYSKKRRALAALALTTDTSILTAVPNDESFEAIFARQVEALGRPGDVLVALSTSGTSPNILRALEKAKAVGMITIGLTGEAGDSMAENSDILLKVASPTVARIQESHITLGHIMVQVVESEVS